MIKQILVWVDNSAVRCAGARWAINLAQALAAQLYETIKQQVRLALLLETGDKLKRLQALSRCYKTDLLVVSASCPISVFELHRQSYQPIVFIKEPPIRRCNVKKNFRTTFTSRSYFGFEVQR